MGYPTVRFLRNAFACLLLAVLSTTALAQRNLTVEKILLPANEKRVALVIGNSAYKNSPLKNPTNDAKDMAAKLRTLGFEVIERSNITTRQIGGTLRELRSRLTPGGVALVFYAGHGLQIKGENYLPAVDAEIATEEDVPNQSIAVRQIIDVLDDTKTRLNLVFLDACRNNPYARSFRSTGAGLAKVSAPSGTLISFATRPGGVAVDGVGGNGLYTSQLLKQMDEVGQPIEQVLKRVVSGVRAASKGHQEPWMEGSIEGDFYFRPAIQVATIAPDSVAIADPVANDRAFWNSVKDSKNAEELKAYLDKFPNGLFVRLAEARLKPFATTTFVPAGTSSVANQRVRPTTTLSSDPQAIPTYTNRVEPNAGASIAFTQAEAQPAPTLGAQISSVVTPAPAATPLQKAEPKPVEIGRVKSVYAQYGYFVVAINNRRFANLKKVIVFSGNEGFQGTVEKHIADSISVTPNDPKELGRIRVGDGAFVLQ
jgi:uncharacterized caspase-like protein